MGRKMCKTKRAHLRPRYIFVSHKVRWFSKNVKINFCYLVNTYTIHVSEIIEQISPPTPPPTPHTIWLQWRRWKFTSKVVSAFAYDAMPYLLKLTISPLYFDLDLGHMSISSTMSFLVQMSVSIAFTFLILLLFFHCGAEVEFYWHGRAKSRQLQSKSLKQFYKAHAELIYLFKKYDLAANVISIQRLCLLLVIWRIVFKAKLLLCDLEW